MTGARNPSYSSMPKRTGGLFSALPPELRLLVLELALSPPRDGVDLGRYDHTASQNARSIFLVSKQMYAEALPIFYRDVRVDLRGCGLDSPCFQTAQRFLETATSPRQYVRNATICLCMIDCCNCETAAKLELDEYLHLRTLTVLIGADYMYPPYGCALHPPDRPRYFFNSRLESGAQATGPKCLMESQYQAFLRLLQRPGSGDVTVKAHRSHLDFLCQFHASEGTKECRGCWRGPAEWILLDHRAMVKVFSGVNIDASIAAEKGCVIY